MVSVGQKFRHASLGPLQGCNHGVHLAVFIWLHLFLDLGILSSSMKLLFLAIVGLRFPSFPDFQMEGILGLRGCWQLLATGSFPRFSHNTQLLQGQ